MRLDAEIQLMLVCRSLYFLRCVKYQDNYSTLLIDLVYEALRLYDNLMTVYGDILSYDDVLNVMTEY